MMRKFVAWVMVACCLLAAIPAGAGSFAKTKAGIKYGGVVFRVGQTLHQVEIQAGFLFAKAAGNQRLPHLLRLYLQGQGAEGHDAVQHPIQKGKDRRHPDGFKGRPHE